MTYSLYDATIGMATGAIMSLRRMLAEAEKEVNSTAFLSARLIDDMKPLTFQIHYATFEAQALVARLSGQDYTEPEDDLDSYEKIRARVQQTLTLLDQVDKDIVNQMGEAMTSYVPGRRDAIQVPNKAVAGLVYMPNIYFHVSMTYAILRKEGVRLGKRDWSRAFVREYI